MIIQIRGTSGSGKTTVVRRLMVRFLGDGEAIYNQQFRRGKQPYAYRYPDKDSIVLGCYDSICGGCDHIGSSPKIFDSLKRVTNDWKDIPKSVITEGLLWSEDVKWTMEILKICPVHIVFLTTPIDNCLKRLTLRQVNSNKIRKSSDGGPTNRSRFIKRAISIERAYERLATKGNKNLIVTKSSSNKAPKIIMNWIENAK